MRRLFPVLLLLLSSATYAAENVPRVDRDRDPGARHFILTAQHTLRPAEEANLAAEGVEIQHVLPDRRYVVLTANADAVAADPFVASLDPLLASSKIERSAYREAAMAKPFARVRILFHDDVTFDDARSLIERVGGAVDDPLQSDFSFAQRVAARIPFAALSQIAADDRVFIVFGPARKIAPLNAVAALLSHVTPLYGAPYNLSGQGVVVSEFEFAKADASHPAFGGRLDVTNAVGSDSGNALHATHVAGTIMANPPAPQDAAAKGMAPAARLFEFNANDSYPDVVLQSKKTKLPPLGIVADNNSWGFPISWQNTDNGWVWYGFEDDYGVYDPDFSSPYDALAKTSSVLFVQAAGNDGAQGNPILPSPYSNHLHVNDNGDIIKGETFCYSVNGSGTDCEVPCTQTAGHCEIVKHPTHGAFNTLGPTAVLKNVIAVGATNPDGTIASFSSRGPTGDGRVKPDVVAKGNRQYSTVPGGTYANDQGTSMSTPVITGIAALLVEQWRKTFGGNPTPEQLKTVLIAGADDRGAIGPDYTYGFGLANAQASVDLMIADNNTGSRIRNASIAQGQQIDTPLIVGSQQNLRVVLGWIDPEVLLSGTNAAAKTLVNDLDVKVVDPSGNQVLPYVLDRSNPTANATRGVNTADNTEEVEIANAAAGTYHVIVTGTNVASAPTVPYVLVANAQLGAAAVPCNDPFEPNDTEATAFGNLVKGETLTPSLCSASDVDYFRIQTTAAGPLTVTVTTIDTPLRVTLSGNGIAPIVKDIAAGSSGSVTTQSPAGVATYIVKIEPTGAIGPNHTYTLVPTFATAPVARRRSTRH